MNALELFLLNHEAKLGHMRACTHKWNLLSDATQSILMPLIQAAHKGYPLSQLVGYDSCTYITWYKEHGPMLEGMGYRVQQEHGASLYSTGGKVYCQVNREFVQDMVTAQHMQQLAKATGNPLWM
jgi:hypothetical protein